MSRWTPCKRRHFIIRLKKLGFDGPYAGARHQFMVYKSSRLTIPTNEEYSIPQLKMMIREIEDMIGEKISLEQWDSL